MNGNIARLIKKKDGNYYVKDVVLEEHPEKLKGLLNKTRWDILKMLAERPRYPAEMAKKLGVHEQKVYYHIKQLRKNGLIEVDSTSEKGGALAKYYSVKEYGFALELPYGDEKLMDFPIQEQNKKVTQFLTPFIKNGELNAKIVVGSPDPHGPNQTRARDGHYANDLSFFLGQYATAPEVFSTKLDVDVKAEKDYRANLICIGGPLTNMVTDKFNRYLTVRFESEKFPYRKMTSKKTGKDYVEDSVGAIQKIVNPEDQEKRVLVLSGVRYVGTKASVLALSHYPGEVLESYNGEDNWACVVKGKDMDGDGKIDDIEVLE